MQGLILSFVGYTFMAFGDIVNKLIGSNLALSSHIFWIISVYLLVFLNIGLLKYSIRGLFLTDKFLYVIIRACFAITALWCVLYALPRLNLITFYTIVALQPMIVSGIAIVLRIEKLYWNKIGIILLSLIGVLVHLDVWRVGFGSVDLLGLSLVFCGVISVSLGGIISKAYLQNEKTLTLGVYQGFLGVLTVLGILMLAGDLLDGISKFNFWLVLAGIFIAAGSYCFTKSYQISSKVQVISQMQYTQFLWGAIFGALIFGDPITFIELVGVLIIIGAGVLNWKTTT